MNLAFNLENLYRVYINAVFLYLLYKSTYRLYNISVQYLFSQIHITIYCYHQVKESYELMAFVRDFEKM